VGRSRVITPELAPQLEVLLAAGVTQRRASLALGVSERSISRFVAQQRQPAPPETLEEVLGSLPRLDEVLADLDRPRPRPRRPPKRDRGWQAAAAWLERERPGGWAPRAPDDGAA
jgi:hypothetical protein